MGVESLIRSDSHADAGLFPVWELGITTDEWKVDTNICRELSEFTVFSIAVKNGPADPLRPQIQTQLSSSLANNCLEIWTPRVHKACLADSKPPMGLNDSLVAVEKHVSW